MRRRDPPGSPTAVSGRVPADVWTAALVTSGMKAAIQVAASA
ncbi:hypothetical protein [Kitasatospora cheerisanensis]|uniref:Uncharacterized protein n=1 Tax=Kitasatospora cheerisanensis KCTC 2395 TaxID=1348663 RepID=A0A066YJZ1_9ACTN|nr:hypothetical protein [Kitasatospora cheerisanensis]KDN81487.1 hypothetical protein KCH_67250 [Kitasatospora cheerisanensis KCTC 2395]